MFAYAIIVAMIQFQSLAID